MLTTVTSSGNIHNIAYDVYVNGEYSDASSTQFTVKVLGEYVYRVYDGQRDVIITSDASISADQTMILPDVWVCSATAYLRGHGSVGAPTCYWQAAGFMNIGPTLGTTTWTAASTMYIFWIPYQFDQIKISPRFINNDSYWSNSLSGSLSFPGIYSAHDAYSAMFVFYYER